MKTIKGKVSFGRVSGSSDNFRIILQDENSRCQAVEIKIEAKDIADFFSNRYTECEFDWNDSGNVGKQIEHRVASITFPDIPYDRKKAEVIVEPILKQYEIEGWVANRYSVYNSRHKASSYENGGTKFYVFEVSFDRWV